MSGEEVAKKASAAMARIALYVVLYVIVAAIVQWIFTSFLLPFIDYYCIRTDTACRSFWILDC